MPDQPSLPPDTTAQEDVSSQNQRDEEALLKVGQRRINLIWETTQAIVAIVVTVATLFVAAKLALSEKAETAAFLLLSNAFFVVISTYLTRTNHTKQGGVASSRRGE